MNDDNNSTNNFNTHSEDIFKENEAPSDMPKNKLIKSRNAWMQRANDLSKQCRKMQDQIRNLTESRETWKAKAKHRNELNDEIESLKRENIELKNRLEKTNSRIEDYKKKA